MRMHSDVLKAGHFWRAQMAAGVDLVDFKEVGSRSRARAFKFSLLGNSPYQRGFGARKNGEHAATWDEWGIFLAHLFKVDPNAHCGGHSYQSAEHFHWTTGDRFRTLKPADQHKRHKWEPLGACLTGTFAVAECECGAVQRWLLGQRKWSDISLV